MIRIRRKRRFVAFVVLPLIIIAAIYLGSKYLIIKKIEVTGAKKFSSEYIVNLSGIIAGQNILQIDEPKVEADLESNPYIVVRKIERVFPDRVIIKIRERVASIQVQYMNSWLLLDSEGVVLEVAAEPSQNLLKFTGLQIQQCQPGKYIETASSNGFTALTELAALLTPENTQAKELRSYVKEINLFNPLDVRIKTPQGITVRLGIPEGIDTKLNWMSGSMKELIALGKTGGLLDVSVAEQDKVFYTEEYTDSTQ